jgi:hypothetical protein
MHSVWFWLERHHRADGGHRIPRMRASASTERLWKPRTVAVCLGLGMLLHSGCGSSSSQAPSPADVSGVWLGEQTLTSFTGGECLAPVFQDLVGYPSQFRATLTQSGTSVTATLDIDHTGSICTYTGSIEGDALVLTTTSCSAPRVLAVPCASGSARGLLLQSEKLRATLSGNRIVGTAVEDDNVVASGSSDVVGPLVANGSFSLSRQ